MKNIKKWLSLGMAATMLIGSTTMVFASNEGGATSSGNYEGYVEEISAFSVTVPTDAAATAGLDFFVDPNGLLKETNYARISGATAAEFETDSTLYFTRTVTDSVVKYGKDSDSITFTNMSSYAVDVEVTASVTGADGIELGAVGDDTTDPTIYLALVGSDSTTEAITADGATLTGTIAGEPSNFETQYNSTDSKYEYVQRTATDDNPLAAWKTYSFNLTGACGGTWTDAQAEVAPTVVLTWKVTDPQAVPVVTDDYKITINADGTASYTFVEAPDTDTTGITALSDGTDRMTVVNNSKVTYENGTLTFAKAPVDGWVKAASSITATINGEDFTFTVVNPYIINITAGQDATYTFADGTAPEGTLTAVVDSTGTDRSTTIANNKVTYANGTITILAAPVDTWAKNASTITFTIGSETVILTVNVQ